MKLQVYKKLLSAIIICSSCSMTFNTGTAEDIHNSAARIYWSEESDTSEIQAGISIFPEKKTYELGDLISVNFYFKNCSKNNIQATLPNKLSYQMLKSFSINDAEDINLSLKGDQGGTSLVGSKLVSLSPGNFVFIKGFQIILGQKNIEDKIEKKLNKEKQKIIIKDNIRELRVAKAQNAPIPSFSNFKPHPKGTVLGSKLINQSNEQTIIFDQSKALKIKATLINPFNSNSKYLETGELKINVVGE